MIEDKRSPTMSPEQYRRVDDARMDELREKIEDIDDRVTALEKASLTSQHQRDQLQNTLGEVHKAIEGNNGNVGMRIKVDRLEGKMGLALWLFGIAIVALLGNVVLVLRHVYLP